MEVITRFRVPADAAEAFLAQARAAIALLAARPGFRSATLGRATDDAALYLITSRWADVGSYRRALSAYEVKTGAVPLLSTAIDEPSAFEVLHERDGDRVLDAPSALAADAGTVGLGQAAAPHVPALGIPRFADLADGGRALVLPLQAYADRADVILLAVLPNGVPGALVIAAALGVPVAALEVQRPEDGDLAVRPPDGLAGRTVIVVDDGVETGRVARAAAEALRAAGVASAVLAVPVCPREALADLALRYDDVVAVVRPLGRRALSWHYEAFDRRSEAQARAELAAYCSPPPRA